MSSLALKDHFPSGSQRFKPSFLQDMLADPIGTCGIGHEPETPFRATAGNVKQAPCAIEAGILTFALMFYVGFRLRRRAKELFVAEEESSSISVVHDDQHSRKLQTLDTLMGTKRGFAYDISRIALDLREGWTPTRPKLARPSLTGCIAPQRTTGTRTRRESLGSTPQDGIDARQNKLESAAGDLAQAVNEDFLIQRGHQRDVRDRVLR